MDQMSPQRFQQIRNLFEAALERQEDRAEFLEDACGPDLELRQQVERLLEANDATATIGLALADSPHPDRTDPSALEGRRVGDYEILREIGSGGMGRVYLARRADEAFQRKVAIKILRADLASRHLIERFQRERQILAELDHPNIARLLDAGETDSGLPYFVMEYAEGSPITKHADNTRLPLADRIRLFLQVCDAVEYAHQRGIVHRDLKPGNVLVNEQGQVKLLDFGIARLMEHMPEAATLTRDGMWIMTPEYASPEQVRGETAGRASDIYALGVILFELLTGHRPHQFRRRVFHEIVRVINEELPTRPSVRVTQPVETAAEDGTLSTLPPETTGRLRRTSSEELRRMLSGDLDNVILKALEKSPGDRFRSALQLRDDLARYLAGEPVWAGGASSWRSIGRRLSQYRVALVLTVALVAAVITGSIRLEWTTLGWAAGAAALIGLWHAATDKVAGRRLANNPVFSPAMLGSIAALAIIFTGYRIIAMSFLLLGLIQLGGWFTRGRWGGPLLLDLQTRALALTIAYIVFGATTSFLIGDDPDRIWYAAIMASAAAFCYTEASEIRQNGFVRHGRLISWGRIACWNWEDGKLILHLHRRIQFLRPVKLKISSAHRATVEAILKRQLGDWPEE